jgi:hypothetical protein
MLDWTNRLKSAKAPTMRLAQVAPILAGAGRALVLDVWSYALLTFGTGKEIGTKLSAGPLFFPSKRNAPKDNTQHINMEYKALPDACQYIRLINLLRRLPSGEVSQPHINLQCSLEIHKLGDAHKPSYHALSYQWGEQYPGQTYPAVEILADNHIIKIGKNLAAALERIRDHERQGTGDLLIWADALSINQKDDVEKGEQIKRMRDIYAFASSTKVWLGDEGRGMDILEHIDTVASAMIEKGAFEASHNAQDARRKNNVEVYNEWQLKADKLLAEVQEMPEAKRFPFGDFVRFLELPYWSRGWIMQEVTMSKTIEFMYGEGSPISMLKLRATVTFAALQARYYTLENERRKNAGEQLLELERVPAYQALINWKQNATTVLGLWRTYQEDSSPHWPMLRILSEAHLDGDKSTDITNPKDRIFAFLGLAGDHEPFEKRLDYSMTETAVYTEATRIMIEHGQTDVIAYVCESSEPRYDLPSWVPNWNGMIRKPSNGVPYDSPFHSSSHDSKSQEPPKLSPPCNSPRHLHIQAIILDTIEEKGGLWLPETPNTTTVGAFLKETIIFCAKSDAKEQDIYVTPADRQSARYVVPVADRQATIQNISRISFLSTRETFRKGHEGLLHICNLTERYRREDTTITEEERQQNLKDYTDDVTTYFGFLRDTGTRRPFLSKRGYVGLGPASMQTGDSVCILAGAKFPYILRKCSQTCGSFELIGEGYVHGIMYGEATQQSASWTDIELL